MPALPASGVGLDDPGSRRDRSRLGGGGAAAAPIATNPATAAAIDRGTRLPTSSSRLGAAANRAEISGQRGGRAIGFDPSGAASRTVPETGSTQTR